MTQQCLLLSHVTCNMSTFACVMDLYCATLFINQCLQRVLLAGKKVPIGQRSAVPLLPLPSSHRPSESKGQLQIWKLFETSCWKDLPLKRYSHFILNGWGSVGCSVIRMLLWSCVVRLSLHCAGPTRQPRESTVQPAPTASRSSQSWQDTSGRHTGTVYNT